MACTDVDGGKFEHRVKTAKRRFYTYTGSGLSACFDGNEIMLGKISCNWIYKNVFKRNVSLLFLLLCFDWFNFFLKKSLGWISYYSAISTNMSLRKWMTPRLGASSFMTHKCELLDHLKNFYLLFDYSSLYLVNNGTSVWYQLRLL